MIPILHTSRYDGTTNTIIGRLSDCISCEVVEELNGQYELEIHYVTDGINAKELKTGRVILAQADDRSYNIQPFRIYNVRTDVTGYITVNAEHISYDLNKMVINPFTATGIANVISAIPSNIEKRSIDLLPWAFQSNLTNTTSQINLKYPKNLRSFLGGSDGSLLDVFGGEFEWDGFTVKLNSSRGEDRSVYIRYGVNLIDLEKAEQYEKTYTHVMCYYYDSETDTNVQMADAIAVHDLAQYESDVIQSRTKLIDVTDKFQDSVPTVTDLRNLAIEYANKMSAAPSVGVNVEFIDLRKANENTGVEPTVRLGDTVHIVYNPLNISETKKIVKTIWNVLGERYDQLVVGVPEATLGQTIMDFSSSSSAGGGGGGSSAVTSVNGYTGDVVLTFTDVGAQATLVSGTNIKTINNQSLLGSGNINIQGGGGEANVIEVVQKNGVALPVSNKTVNVIVPTKTSDITNDSNFVSDASYVHSDNNFTTALKNKLDGIEAGAEVNAIDVIVFNGSALPINGGIVEFDALTSVPVAAVNRWGLIKLAAYYEPSVAYAEFSYAKQTTPGDVIDTFQVPRLINGTMMSRYLPDATYTQKGAITLNEWIGTITDNYDEYGNEGYDSTLDGYVRTVTTTDGHFTLTSGNKIRIDNVSFSGYHKHFLNVDGTGAIELLFAPNYSVYTGEIGGIVIGSIEVLYNGTNYIIINGYAYKQPTVPSIPVTDVKVANGTPYPPSVVSNTVATIPAADSSTYGVVQLFWNNDPGAGWAKLKGSNQYSVYVPYLYAGSSTPSSETIRAKWLPDASSSVKGAVIVDNAMSDSSTNPVQNSVVKAYIDSHSGTPSASSVTFDDTNCSVIQAQEVQTAIEALDFYLDDTMGRTLPNAPNTAGTYFLKSNVVNSSSKTYEWESEVAITTAEIDALFT